MRPLSPPRKYVPDLRLKRSNDNLLRIHCYDLHTEKSICCLYKTPNKQYLCFKNVVLFEQKYIFLYYADSKLLHNKIYTYTIKIVRSICNYQL